MAQPIPVPFLTGTRDFDSESAELISRVGEDLSLKTDAAEEVVSKLQHSYRKIKDKIENAVSTIDRRVRLIRAERPLQVVLAVAAISFALGIGLRLWRIHHESR